MLHILELDGLKIEAVKPVYLDGETCGLVVTDPENATEFVAVNQHGQLFQLHHTRARIYDSEDDARRASTLASLSDEQKRVLGLDKGEPNAG